MSNKQNPILEITGVMIQDPETKGYTAYFAEFPEVIAQGENIDAAKENLFSAFQSMIEFKSSEAKEEFEDDDSIITQTYPLSFA